MKKVKINNENYILYPKKDDGFKIVSGFYKNSKDEHNS